MWKALFDVIRNKVDVEVDLDIDDGRVLVEVTLKFGKVTLFTEHVGELGDVRERLAAVGLGGGADQVGDGRVTWHQRYRALNCSRGVV